MIRVISDAHVPGNDGFYFISVVRDGNSARLFEHYALYYPYVVGAIHESPDTQPGCQNKKGRRPAGSYQKR